MKGLIITVIAAIVLATAAASMQRSLSLATNGKAGAAGIPSLQEMQSAADVNKLPAQTLRTGPWSIQERRGVKQKAIVAQASIIQRVRGVRAVQPCL